MLVKFKGYLRGDYQTTSVQCPRCLAGKLQVKYNLQLRQNEYFVLCDACGNVERPLRLVKSMNYS